MESKAADNDPNWRTGSRPPTPVTRRRNHNWGSKSRHQSSSSFSGESASPLNIQTCQQQDDTTDDMDFDDEETVNNIDHPSLGNKLEETNVDLSQLLTNIQESQEQDQERMQVDQNLKLKEAIIYGDNSNIFIAAQKFAGKKLNLQQVQLKSGKHEAMQDPRARIDWPRLCEIIADERNVIATTLYCSEPPSLQDMQKTLSAYGIEVIIFPKSEDGKEKEVDTSLVADAVDDIVTYFRDEYLEVSFVIVSGDLDFACIARKGLKYGQKVEIWAFAESLSDKMMKLGENHPNVSIHTLDQLFDQFVFCKYECKPRPVNEFPRKSLLILEYESSPVDECRVDDRLIHAVMKSTDFFKIPTQGFYLKECGSTLAIVAISGEFDFSKRKRLAEEIEGCDDIQTLDEYARYKDRPLFPEM